MAPNNNYILTLQEACMTYTKIEYNLAVVAAMTLTSTVYFFIPQT